MYLQKMAIITFPKLTFLSFGKVIIASGRGNCLEAIITKRDFSYPIFKDYFFNPIA
jgi:hypothetical protein